MPAISLGVAEVEEQLRRIRRRVNGLLAQQAAYVSLAVLCASISGVIVAALHASGSGFRLAAAGAGGLSMLTLAAAALSARRRWLSLAETARYVDGRAALADRLGTLLDVRSKARPPRLGPLLIAQTLSLRSQWQPTRVAPRRTSRLVWLMLLSVAGLITTIRVARRPDRRQAVAHVSGSGERAAGTLASTAAAAPADEDKVTGTTTDVNAGGGAESQTGRPGSGGNQLASVPGSLAGRADKLRPGAADKLQSAIRRALQAEPIGALQRVADAAEHRSDADSSRNDEQTRHQDRNGRASADAQAGSNPPGTNASSTQPQGRGTQRDSHGKPQDTAPHNYDGTSPPAGSGSAPGDLMAAGGPGVTTAADATKPFKLTISSFLHATAPVASQPRPGHPRSGSAAAAVGAAPAVPALNDRQLADAAVRKAEIPPEYEDLVRRVYSLRGDE